MHSAAGGRAGRLGAALQARAAARLMACGAARVPGCLSHWAESQKLTVTAHLRVGTLPPLDAPCAWASC